MFILDFKIIRTRRVDEYFYEHTKLEYYQLFLFLNFFNMY